MSQKLKRRLVEADHNLPQSSKTALEESHSDSDFFDNEGESSDLTDSEADLSGSDEVDSESESDNNVSEQSEEGDETPKVLSNGSPPVLQKVDEYAEHDTSDEEDIRNTIGNVPMKWYDEYKHIGYDWDGEKIEKPAQRDQLDAFLQRIEDPEFWRTVKDPQTGKEVVLTDEDVKLIKRINAQRVPDENFTEYAPWVEWFTSEVMKTPLRKFPEHKRSFLPSKIEAKRVSRMVHALKMGWIKTNAQYKRLKAKKKDQFYMLWQTDSEAEKMRRIHDHIPAPKRFLPGHAESYNPPSEYLFDERELQRWHKQEETPWKRKLHFVPAKHGSLREVPAYARYVKERFLRCLDLYMCPRGIKLKLTIGPEALVPKLPSPKNLQPFPTYLAITYEGHTDMVRTIDTDKTGQYLVSGSDDGTVKIWEINTGRCLKTINTESVVRCVRWCPNQALSLILVASGNKVILLNPDVGDFLISAKTDTVLKESPKSDTIINERVRTTVQWAAPSEAEYGRGFRAVLTHFKEVTQVTWHGKGDYFAVIMPDGQNRSVLIGQVSKRKSQLPFTKPKGLVQSVIFHPSKPYLFVATQRHIRIYDLIGQALVKKLMSSSQWIATMDIHPGGDNLLVATYDRKVLWFDLDLSTKPYQTLRLHGTAVRAVSYHKRYPLFASCSDDKSVIVSHGMVYNDLMQNPLIVPLKRFAEHKGCNDFGVFDVRFHPLQPWVFSAGADGTIKLYCN
ncbi:hypothetical protein PPYR_14127 [Photinus pyralis]|uniref:Ribosome biogenesis protein BOP1 homolog n=1 Tax=Photinus pyralis TaxID=7054 RepID=A0A5N4A4E7_PHOPY|nr:ribosome biogenesis protein BOP1 homolog isoform X2 [Photinus pyralis]KAB0792168.1 hypothetical protein PPYR_14127 [Photinus pyralis]